MPLSKLMIKGDRGQQYPVSHDQVTDSDSDLVAVSHQDDGFAPKGFPLFVQDAEGEQCSLSPSLPHALRNRFPVFLSR